MPRQSKAELATVAVIQGQRKKAPRHFCAKKKKIWNEITATKPFDWFTDENTPLLEAYVESIAEFREVTKEANDARKLLDKDDMNSILVYKELSKLSDMAKKAMMQLATKMRLTQQARYDTQKAHTASKKVDNSKPWQRTA